MSDGSAAARAQVAARKLKRANGLLREATAELRAALDDTDIVGSARASDADSRAEVDRLVAFGVATYGEVEVVVIARPRRRANTHHGPQGAKEADHHASSSERAPARPAQRIAIT